MNHKVAALLLSFPLFIISNQDNLQRLAALKKATDQQKPRELLQLTSESIIAPRDLGDNLSLLQADTIFTVVHNGELHKVRNNNIDSILRGMSTSDLKKFLADNNGLIKISQKSDGQFALEGQVPLHGGGLIGAKLGFLGGKFVVHLVTQLGIGIVTAGACIFATPAVGIPLGIALEKTVAPIAEVASNVVGLGTGIAVGTITGPV